MKLNSIFKRRLTLLLSAAMVFTSVIPSGVPVYANELPDDNTALIEEQTDEAFFAQETSDLIEKPDSSDGSSPEVSYDETGLFEDPDEGDISDEITDNDASLNLGADEANEPSLNTKTNQVSIYALAYDTITYDEYNVSGNLIKKDITVERKSPFSDGFRFNVSDGGKIVIKRAEFSDYYKAKMYDGNNNLYAFPGKLTIQRSTAQAINPDYSGEFATWTISNITSDRNYDFDYKYFCLDDLVTCSTDKSTDKPVQIVAYSGIKGHDSNYNEVTYLDNIKSGNWVNGYSSNKNNSFYVQLNPYEYDKNNTYKITGAKYKDASGNTKTASVTYKLGYYEVAIPRSDVVDLLVKSGKKLDLIVTQQAVAKTFQFTIYDKAYGVQETTASYDDSYIETGSSMEVKKGGVVNIKTLPIRGFNITGISLNTISISTDKLGADKPVSSWRVLNDKTTVKKLTSDEGFDYTVNEKTGIRINASAYKWTELSYDDDTPLTGTNNRYRVSSDKSVMIMAFDGESLMYPLLENSPGFVIPNQYFFTLSIGGKDITKEALSENIVYRSAFSYTRSDGYTEDGYSLILNTNNKLVKGKVVTLKLKYNTWSGKVAANDFATFVFDVENPDNRSVTLEKDSDSMPIGTRSRSYAVDVTGDFVPVITSPGNGINASLSNDCKKLTISTTKDADEGTYKIDFLDQVRNKTLATFTLTLEATSVARTVPTAIVSGTTNNKISMVLSTGDLDRNLDGLYYVITAKTDSKTTPLEKTVTIKVSATVTSADIWLTKNTASTDGEPTDYNISVQLVQYNDNNDAVALSRTVTTEARTMDGNVFAESITLTGNGSKVHTKTGSGNPYRMTVGYSKGTSIQRLEKVELIAPDGPDKKLYSETVGSGKSGKWLAVDDSSIRFYPQPYGLPAGTYTIKAYAVEPQGKAVTASVSVKVNQAIEELEITGVPAKVIKLPGKETSFTLTAIDATDSEHKVPTKNVTWSIEGNSEIKIKNGKVTIPKTYRVKENDSFCVIATANDYKGNSETESVQITVTNSFSNNIGLKFLDKNLNWSSLSSNEILASDVFHTYYRNYSDVARVTLVETSGQKDGILSKYSVTGATLLGVVEDEEAYYANGSYYPAAYIAFTKPGTVKITATATDGSERKLVKTLKVKYLSGGALGFKLYEGGYDELNNYDYDKDNVSSAKSFNFTNRGTENMPITLNVAGYKDSLENRSLIDHSVSVKGGKLISYKNRRGIYTIYPNSDTTVITIRNNSNRDNTLTITVDNPAIANKKGKLKITAYNKANGKDAKGTIYNSINFKDAGNYSSVCPNKVTYTLANADDAAYALITVLKDDPNRTISDIIERYDDDNLRFGNCYVYNLSGSGKDKTFTVDYASSEGIFDIAEGTYSFSVTPAIRSGNMFIATDKAATVSVKAVKTPVAKVIPVKNVYFYSTSGTINSGNTAVIKAGKYTNYTGAYGVKFTGTLSVADKKGKWNNFSSNFKVATDGTLTYKGSTALNTKAKASKPELNGKVSYSYQLLNGKVVTGYAPVVIKTQKPKATKKK